MNFRLIFNKEPVGADQNLREIFEELKEYVPTALSVIRTHAGAVTQPEVDIEEIFEDEDNQREVSFEEMEREGTRLDCSTIRILQLARFIQEGAGKSEKEISEEITKALGYESWKENQN